MDPVAHPTPTRPARSPFYLHLSCFFLVVALVGFSTTFFAPMVRGTLRAPFVVHLHGVLMFGWLLLLIAQSLFVRTGRMRIHRRAGWIGAAVTPAIVASGFAAGAFATRRDLAESGQSWPFGAFVNTAIEMLVFGALVGTAIVSRRRPEAHKRYLVLATISALGPAWFRFRHFLAFVPNPIVTFALLADAVLLFVMARDWLVQKRVHRVYLWAGGAMVAVHLVELAAADSELWTRIGRWLLQAMPE